MYLGFCHEHALILYVYMSNDDMESVLTVRFTSILLPPPILLNGTNLMNSTTSRLTALDTQRNSILAHFRTLIFHIT